MSKLSKEAFAIMKVALFFRYVEILGKVCLVLI